MRRPHPHRRVRRVHSPTRNWSECWTCSRGVSLAPFYDLLSTVAYPDLSPNLAMKIAKRATLEEIGQVTWTAFAEDIGLPASFVRRRVRELSDGVSRHVPPLPDSAALTGLDASALKNYAAFIASRAERLAKTITT